MVFQLFKTRCPVCKMEVNKKAAINRFGKYFCSEAHAQRYQETQAGQLANNGDHGCCR